MSYLVEPGSQVIVLFSFTTAVSPTSSLSKNGAAFVATTNSAVEIASGYYNLTLTGNELTEIGTYLLRVFLAPNPEYWAIIQVRPIISSIEKTISTLLTKQFTNVVDSIDKSLSTVNRGLKQFIATENLTTRAVTKRK